MPLVDVNTTNQKPFLSPVSGGTKYRQWSRSAVDTRFKVKPPLVRCDRTYTIFVVLEGRVSELVIDRHPPLIDGFVTDHAAIYQE
jgi:hypothetical protein